MKRAVILTSGGLDSTTCLAVARDRGYELIALSVAYGQRHEDEVECAKRIGEFFGVKKHLVLDLGLYREIGGSALTADIPVPKDREMTDMGGDVPCTYVPARNMLFLSYAVATAEILDAEAVYIGVNAVDYSGYPDCRPDFIASFAKTAALATRVGSEGHAVRIEAPLQNLSKAEIVKLGTKLGAPYHLTRTCYDPQGDLSCGLCDACKLRLQGFREAGLVDPVPYVVR